MTRHTERQTPKTTIPRAKLLAKQQDWGKNTSLSDNRKITGGGSGCDYIVRTHCIHVSTFLDNTKIYSDDI
jgi:hypothetical protein